MTPRVLATLHLSGRSRGEGVGAKEGGLGYYGKRAVTRQDWSKIPDFLRGEWPRPVPPAAWDRDAWFERAMNAPFVAIDTEYHPKTLSMNLLGMGFRYPGEEPSVIQFTGSDWISEELGELVRHNRVVFQNAVADLPVLQNQYGLWYSNFTRIDDTMLAHAVLWSELPHTLDFLASVYGRHEKAKHLAHVDPEKYNRGDVVDTISAWEALEVELERDLGAQSVYEGQSLPLIPVILEAMHGGIMVDREAAQEAVARYEAAMVEAQRLAQASAGWPLNLGSPQQLAHWFYKVRGFPEQKKKDDRTKLTVSEDAIAAIRNHIGPPVDPEEEPTITTALQRVESGADAVVEARVVFSAARQVTSHYLKPAAEAERVHPRIAIHAQASGRWSITDPPMQQLPKDTRDIFIPDAGQAWVGGDYDQAELRLIAALAKDKPLLETFAHGHDVHTLNACDLFGLPHPPDLGDPHGGPGAAEWRQALRWEGKDDPRRVFAKRFIYRLNYGGHPCYAGDIPGAKGLGLGPRELVVASTRYLSAHPALVSWRRGVEAEAKKTRVSRTFMGRPRVLLGDAQISRCRSCGQTIPGGIVREAYNHPLQGGVSDILNLTVLGIKAVVPVSRLVYTMHDSFWFSVPVALLEEARQWVEGVTSRKWNVGGVEVQIPCTLKTRESE